MILLQEFHSIDVPSSFLATVSRTVSHPNLTLQATPIIFNETRDTVTKKNSVMHLAMWIHIFGCGIVLFAFWTDFIPALGRVNIIVTTKMNINV